MIIRSALEVAALPRSEYIHPQAPAPTGCRRPENGGFIPCRFTPRARIARGRDGLTAGYGHAGGADFLDPAHESGEGSGMHSLSRIEQAGELIRTVMPPTPQYCWPLLGRRVGAEVWVKHENHTPIGAFKLRGGLVYLAGLKQAEPGIAGVISATRGNHGQSLALAAARFGMPAVIVVPFGNSREKNDAMRAFGAELIEHGRDFQEAAEFAARL